LVGLAVVSQSSFDRHNRLVRERAEENGEVLFVYGSANELDRSNASLVGWAVGTWAKGADGILPWQTMGQDASWEEADRLAVLYPAKSRFGRPASSAGLPGAYPSLRLVAFRRGQQDVEYVNLLRRAAGADRDAVAHALIVALGLADEAMVVREDFSPGALDFWSLDAGRFARLRTLLQHELLACGRQ
jgi:hypothetical protein